MRPTARSFASSVISFFWLQKRSLLYAAHSCRSGEANEIADAVRTTNHAAPTRHASPSGSLRTSHAATSTVSIPIIGTW